MTIIDIGVSHIFSAIYGNDEKKGSNVISILKQNINKELIINDTLFKCNSNNKFNLYISLKKKKIIIKNNNKLYLKNIFYKFREYVNDKRIIIVGPSKSLYENKNGKFIDSFDIVCRIKKSYPLDKNKLEYTGKKTDILLSHLKLGNNKYKQNNFDEHSVDNYNNLKYILFPYPKIKHFDRFYNDFKNKFTDIDTQIIYPKNDNTFNKIYNDLNNHDPKIALMSILTLLEYDIKELYLTGLTFQKDGFINTYKTSKEDDYCNDRTKKVHDSKLEFEYFSKHLFFNEKINIDSKLNELILNEKKCIFTACTENYLNRAISLYKSINEYNNDIIFHIILININKNNYFENNKCKKLVIEYNNVNLTGEKLRAYSSCLRASIFPQLSNYKYVFWMDADTIVRNNLNNLFNKLLINDITLHYKPNNIEKQGAYKTGIIGVKMNDKIINFLNDWNNILFSNGINKCQWYDDQKTITKILEKHNKILKINKLENIYIDWKFSNKSIIWVGKGDRKNDTIYLNEESKYK